MKKLSISLLLIVIMILLVSAVSAADINENEDLTLSQDDTTVDEVVSTVDDDVVASDSSEVTVGSGENNFTALKDLIDSSGASGMVKLQKDYIKASGEGVINISNHITINGYSQYKIDANHIGEIFNITSTGYLTLQNVILINGNSTNGGAINNNGVLLIIGGVFANNTATGNGGAIYHDGISLSISGSAHFENNSALNGGAIYNDGDSSEIQGSTFINNKATQNGGAIYNNKQLSVSSHNEFTNNNALNGGAIYNNNELTIDGTNSFDNNKATTDGGAIYNIGSLFAINSATPFTSNVAGGKGGAIYNIGSTFSVEGFTFTNNTAIVSGGAIYTNQSLTIKSTVFNSNKVTGDNSQGAAISIINAQLIIEDSTFEENIANSGLGIIYVSGNTVSIKGSSFKKNKGSLGTLYLHDTTATLVDSNFTNNTPVSGWDVYNNKSSLKLSNNIINNESAGIILCNDGVITSKINITILGNDTVTICNDTAIFNATIIDDNNNLIYDMREVMFLINNADVTAIYNVTTDVYEASYHLPGSGIYLVNITYDANDVDVYVGVIKNINATFTDLQNKINDAKDVLNLTYDFTYNGVIDDNDFTNGITLNKSLTINANGHSIISNAKNRIFNITKDSTLNNIALINGSAGMGGAIYNSATLTINNVTFKNNNATTLGGAIYDEGTLIISNSLFEDNKVTTASKYGADGNGGAAIFTKGTLSVSGSKFISNTAPRDTYGMFTVGGAIYVYKATGTLIDNCIFESNVAGLGGAILFEEYSQDEVTIKNSVFNNNNAWQGGAININSGAGNITIIGSNFTGNTATEPNLGGSSSTNTYPSIGGAISIGTMSSNATTVSITDSLFVKNEAVNGGAISISTKLISNITNCNFTENKATGYGSAITSTGSGINVNKSSFTKNNGGLGAICLNINSNNSISYSNFTGNSGTGNWDIANVGNLSLSKNNISNTSAGIVSWGPGKITSKINITILNNKTVIVSDYNVTLNLTIRDDNGNLIEDQGHVYFVINNTKVLATYKSSLKMYQANYILPSLGLFPVNVSYYDNKILNIKTGAVKNIKGTYTDLQYKINNLTDNSVLNLTYNFTYTKSIDGDDFAEGVLISKVSNLTIHGNGYTISGNNTHRIFTITAPVTLNNITFVNGHAGSNGGAININNVNVLINNSKFINNSANNHGGAIVFNKNLTIIASEFINNTVPISGAYYGGAIFSNSADNLNIIGSKFKGNKAVFGGAINLYKANVNAVIKDSGFIDNYAGGTGGVLYLYNSMLTVNNTNFTSNEGSSSTIYFTSANAIINNSKFTNNKARDVNGGAIELDSGKLNVFNSIFNGNIANGVSKAIYATGGELSLKGNTINKNVAEIVLTGSAKIVSYLNITIVDNTTVDTIDTTVKLNASIVDDECNLINANGFKFTITGLTDIDATYNPTSKLYEATTTLPEKVAIYTVNVTYEGNDKLDNYIGILRNIKGTFTDLQNKINNATDKLELKYNFTYSDLIDKKYTNSIIINESISVDGNGFTIDAKNTARVFNITNSKSLTLKNIVIKNANATIGAGVYVNKGSTLIADYVNFTNNAATYRGGAVYSEGSVKVNNSVFDLNDITYRSGAASEDNGGAAIFNLDGSLEVNNSKFTNNIKNYINQKDDGTTGDYIDGVITASGSNVIDNSVFDNNSARFGADICISNVKGSTGSSQLTLTISNSNFTNARSYAGGIYINNVNANILNSNFRDYVAGGVGSPGYSAAGGVICAMNDSILTIDNSTFINNTAPKAGAILAQKVNTVTITNSKFINNTATGTGNSKTKGYGGAVLIELSSGESTIDKSVFRNNTAINGGAIGIVDNVVTIKNSNFTNNSATKGSAIFNNGTLKLSKNNITSNKTEIVSIGKITSDIIVKVLGNTTVVTDEFKVKLNATITDDNGNFINDKSFNFTIRNVKNITAIYNESSQIYEANYTLTYAGSYIVNITYLETENLKVKIGIINCTRGTFTDLQNKVNKAKDGVLNLTYNFIYDHDMDNETLKEGIVISKDLVINGNGSIINGSNVARIFKTTAPVTINNVKFVEGSTSGSGAAILASADLIVNCSVFENNNVTTRDTTEIDGVAIAASGNKLTVINSNFTNNIVDYVPSANIQGGAIGSLCQEVLIDNCIFINNPSYLGAIMLWTSDSKGKAVINNSRFEDNYGYFGGAIFAQKMASLVVNNSVFKNNTGYQGGALYSDNTPLVVDNSKFIDNKVKGTQMPTKQTWASGGAIIAKSKMTITNSNFTDNYAEYNGAAIYYQVSAYVGASLIENCKFENNYAGSYYGAVYYAGWDSLTVKDSSFINNTADKNRAGALFFSGRNLEVNGGEFINNFASEGGAIYYNNVFMNSAWANENYRKLTIDGVTFKNNTASINGGAVYINNAIPTVKGSTFDGNTANGEANAIYLNDGNLTLEKNTIVGNATEIVINNGEVISQINITVMDNETYAFSFHTINLYAIVTDDNGNLLKDKKFNFTIGTIANVTAVYNENSKRYEANYTPTDVGTFVVNVSYVINNKLNVKTATVSFARSLIDIQNLVNEAKDGDIINLTGNYSYIEEFDNDIKLTGIVVNKTIIIDGKGFTISGNNTARLFNVTTGKFTIKNATFVNASASMGAVIYASSEVIVEDCAFVNNTASKKGGAIYSSGSLSISNSVFENNTIGEGCTYDQSRVDCNGGGAIFTSGSLTVKGSNFTNNTAPYDTEVFSSGGAIYVCGASATLIEDCVFNNNSATYSGAVMFENFNQNTVAVKNSAFNYNKAWQGGAINGNELVGSLIIIGSNFIGNVATTPNAGKSEPMGGAIVVGTKSSDGVALEVSGCNFINNSAYFGGAIEIGKNNAAVITNSNFTNNAANSYGGAVDVGSSSNLTVKGSNFINNTASIMGNAIFSYPGSINNISYSNFTNKAPGYAILSYQATLELFKNNVSGNRAGIYNYNGDILSETKIIILNNETVTVHENNVNLTANVTDDNGNLIKDTTFKFIINGTQVNAVYNNTLNVYTANFTLPKYGIYLVNITSDEDENLTIKTGVIRNIKGTFTDLQRLINESKESGELTLQYNFTNVKEIDGDNFTNGVLIKDAITINGNGSTINANKTARIFNITTTSNVVLNNITFINGNASSGGSIYNKAPLTIVNSTFKDSRSEISGGAIYSSGNLVLNNVSFDSNYVNWSVLDMSNPNYSTGVYQNYGGAVSIIGANLTVVNSSFVGNKGISIKGGMWRLGGAIYVYGANKLLINGTVFENNSAFFGGALFLVNIAQESIAIDNCTFKGNEALNGGAINVQTDKSDVKGYLSINDCQFIDNTASSSGGAILITSDKPNFERTLKVNNSLFKDNSAEVAGAISVRGNVIVDNCEFINNTASNDGAVMTISVGNNKVFHIPAVSKVEVSNSVFENNTASGNGVIAIFTNVTVTAVVDNVTFKNNVALNGGAIYAYENTTLNITDSHFIKNTASQKGGALYLKDSNTTVKNNEFSGNVNAIYVINGTLYLKNNTINKTVAEIISIDTNITSQINVTVMANKTYSFHFDTIKLNATITDDNGNLINDNNFNFTIGKIANVSALYNESNTTYMANYTPTKVGTFVVNVSYISPKLNVKTATVTFSKSLIDIQNLVNKAKDGDVITLDDNYIYIEEFDKDIINGIVVNKTIIIDGKGFTISGNNTSRVFNVTRDLTLKNVSIINASVEDNGAAVYVTGNLTVSDSVFDGNKITKGTSWKPGAPAAGGAAIYATNGAKLNISNSNFTNNCAVKEDYNSFTTGAVYVSGASYLLIDGCLFENNSAVLGGAVTVESFTQDSVAINNSVFNNNTAWQGGAVNINENVTKLVINGCNFTSNGVSSPDIGNSKPNGGAVSIGTGSYGSDVYINNSIFTNNTSSNYSGAIASSNTKNKLNIDGCEFINNTASAGSAIFSVGDLKVNNTLFKYNIGGFATVYLHTGTTNEIKYSNFTNNTATNGWDVVNVGSLSLFKNNVSNSSAEIISYAGGKVTSVVNITILGNDTVTVSNNTVIINATITDDNGNLMDDRDNINFIINGENVTAKYNASIQKFQANYTLPGPGFYLVNVTYETNDKLNIKTGVIRNVFGTYTDLQNKLNHAGTELNLTYNFTYNKEIDAGNFTSGMNITHHDITINGNGFTISGNNSYRIFNITKNVTLKNITFTKGNHTGNGGAIYTTGNLTIDNCTFKENNINKTSSGYIYGSVIYTAKDTTLTVSNSNFTNNNLDYVYSEGSWGAVFVGGNATFDNCIFINNAAEYGGAISTCPTSKNNISVKGSKFINNIAYQGGAVYNEGNAYLNIEDSVFDNNCRVFGSNSPSDWASGGAIVSVDGFTIKNTNFTNNYAEFNGGAIYVLGYSSFSSVIDGCIFENNTAGDSYGAIYFVTADVNYKINLLINNTKFINNTAKATTGYYANAIYFCGNDLIINNTEFINNTGKHSAAISYYDVSGGSLTVDSTNFTGNKATGGIAGAINVRKGNATIINANFNLNSATGNGSAIYIDPRGNVTIKNSNFTANGDDTDYAIYNLGTLALKGNNISNIIYNNGTITSYINATFLSNTTVNTTLGETVKPNATLVDDMGNAIYDPLFRISVRGNNITNITYDKVNRLYTAEYYIVNGGDNVVTTLTYKPTGLKTYIGIYKAAKENVTLNITVEDIIFGENATVQIRLVGINSTNLTGKVSIIVNNNETIIDVINGTGLLNVSGLNPGKYGAVVSFAETVDYNSKINSTVFFVKAETNMTVIVENIIYGENAIVNVTLTYGEDKYNLTSGIVVVNINGTEYNVVIVNGKGSTIVSNLAAGNNYNATAVYETTDYFYTSNSSDLFNVSKYTPTINVTTTSVTYPNDVIVTVISDVSGNYTVKVGKTLKTITLNANIAQNVTFSNLAANESGYLINVTYVLVDKQNYTNASNTTVKAIVKKAESKVVFDTIEVVTYPDTVVVTYTTNATVVDIFVLNGTQKVSCSIISADNQINISKIVAGEYNLTVVVDDENHTRLGFMVNFTVKKYTPVIKVTVENVTYNKDVIVKVESDVDGKYTVKVGNADEQTVILTKNTPKEVTFSGLAANVEGYPVVVIYTQTQNYTDAVNETEKAIVNKAKTIVNITETINGTYNTTNATIKVTLVNETTVTFNITGNNVELLNVEYAKLNETISKLGAGTYTLTILSSESENYTGDSDTETFTIDKATSKVIITPIVDVTYDELVNVTFEVNNITTVTYIIKVKGSDEVVIASTLISNVNATNEIVLPLLNAGNYTIVIVNAESDNFTESSDSANFTVKKATPVINVTVNNVTYPGNVVLNITSDVDGYYTVKVGEDSQIITLKANEYKLVTFAGLDANETGYNINVTYDETTNYNGVSNDTEIVKVFKAGSNVTIDSIVNVVYPSNVEVIYNVENKTTLIVIVTNKDTNAKITIPDANITSTKVIIAGLAAGNYSISINNTGSKNYNASFESAEFNISKYTPQITVSVVDVTYDANVTVSVNSDVSGKYNVSVGDKLQEIELVAGETKDVNFTGIKANEEGYIVNVTYTETQNYTSAYNNESIVRVFKATSSVNITSIANGTYKTVNTTIKVEYINGTDITFNITGVESGKLSELEDVLATLGAGEYTITIYNAGDENHTASNVTGVFSVLKATTSVKITNVVNANYNATVKVEYIITNSTATCVVITKDGVEIIATVEDNENTLNIKDLGAGVYNITIFNDENDNYTASNVTALFEVYKASSSVTITPFNNITYNDTLTVSYNVVNETGINATIINRDTGAKHNLESGELGDGIIVVKDLAAGNYTLIIYNDENDNYTASNATANFTVNKATSSVSIDGIINVTYPNNVSITYNIINQTGTPTVTLKNKETGDEIELKNYDIVISGLASGNYTITIINEANDNYTSSNASANFTVSKYTPVITVSVEDVVYNATVVVTVTSDVDGTYTIKVGDNESTTTVKANTPNEIKFANLNANVDGYQVNVTYVGDDNHTSAYNDTQTVKVIKAASSVEITNIVNGTYKTVNTTIEVTYENGTVTFNITCDGVEVVSGDLDTLETALSSLGAGEYTIVLNNTGDANHNASSTTGVFNISKASSSITIDSIANVTYGANTTIKFSVVNETEVYWTISDASGVIKSGSGSANITDLKLVAGNYTIVISNNENDNYTKSSATSNFTVSKASTSITVDTIANVTYGANTTIKFSVVNETEVSWTINNVDGVVKYGSDNNIDIQLAAGNYTIIIINKDTENYTESTQTLNFTVYKIGSNITVSEFTNVTYGKDLNINFTVVNETGINAAVYDLDGKLVYNLENADFTENGIVVSALNAGNYYVRIINSDSENITCSAVDVYFTILKATPQITVTAVNVTYPGNVIVLVKSDVSGNYQVKVGTTTQDLILTAGEVKNATFGGLDAGNYSVSVSYAETDNYNVASNNTNVSVYKINSLVEITPIINVTYPNAIEITYNVENATTVTITVLDANNNAVDYSINKDGKIIITQKPGNYTINIVNAGTVNVNSANATANLTINRVSEYILNATGENVTTKQNATITVTLPNDANGNVTVKVNGKEYNTTISNGKAVITIDKLGNGTYEATVTFDGDSIYDASNTTVNITVKKIDDYSMNTSTTSPVYGEDAIVTVELPGDATGDITVTFGDDTFDAPVIDGKATIKVSDLSMGMNTVSVSYDGDGNYTPKSTNLNIFVSGSILVVQPMTRGVDSGIDYQARLVNQNGNPVSGMTLIFIIDGEDYEAVTDANGYASIDASLDLGTHSVTVQEPLSGDSATSQVTIVPRIIANSDITMSYLEGKTYSVRIIGDDGNPVGAGVRVTFNLAGKNTIALTDASGYARLSGITNAPGTYTVSASYHDEEVDNKVVINTLFISKQNVKIKKSVINKRGYLGISYNVGNHLKGKQISLKLQGKTYKAKVDNKGKVQLKIPKKIVNKLKVGKKYKYTLIYKLDKKNRYIKVYKTYLLFSSK